MMILTTVAIVIIGLCIGTLLTAYLDKKEDEEFRRRFPGFSRYDDIDV